MRLVKSEIPPQLEFSDLHVCIDCIKGKQTKHTVTKPATRSTQFLRLIHTKYVALSMLLHEVVKRTSSSLLMITHSMYILIYCMKGLILWMS
ncbi:hypothetical protein YC2023_095879 [Brassica napus]